jgi:hypothetical protein
LSHHNIVRYIHPDHEDKIFVLSSLEDTGATFQYTPLFGNAVDPTESLDARNKWRPTKKENQSLLDQQLCIQRLPHKYELVLKDMERIEVNALLVDAYKQNLPKDDAMIGFTQHPSNVVLLKKAKKKEITLFPLGQCSAVADKDLQQVLNKGKQVLVYYNGKAYAIQPFKTWTSFQKADSGCLCPYFFVRACEDEEDARLATTWVDHQGLKIPVLQNQGPLEAHTLLYKADHDPACARPNEAKQPPKKKAKKAQD